MRVRQHCLAAVLVLLALGFGGSSDWVSAAPSAARETGISVKDMIGFRHVLDPSGVRSEPFLSPDGRRYLLITEKGDLPRNGYTVEFWTGTLDTLTKARPRLAKRLFTTALIEANGIYPTIHPASLHVIWLPDSRSVAFLWNDGTKPTDLVKLDLVSGAFAVLVRQRESIEYFNMAPDGGAFTFSVFPGPASCAKAGAISAQSLPLFLATDCVNASDPWRHLTEYVSLRNRKAIPVRVDPGLAATGTKPVFSPNDLFAMVPMQGMVNSDPNWSTYSSREFHKARAMFLADPSGGWLIGAAIIDIRRGTKQLLPFLINPPDRAATALWSPDSKYVAFGPTFLPPSFGSQGNTGRAIVIYDPVLRNFKQLPVPGEVVPQLVEWGNKAGLIVRSGKALFRFKQEGDQWTGVPTTPTRNVVQTTPLLAEIREDLNHPPALVITDTKTKLEKLSWPIEPKLEAAHLGRVSVITWKDNRGVTWKGRLYYPLDYDSARKYPLVVQTHGMAPAIKFSMTGISESYGNVFAAIPLSQSGMFVLQVEDHPGVDQNMEALNQASAYEVGIGYLKARNLIDASRVGISGFSRSGWYVESALAFGGFPYAAAIVSANVNYSYDEAVANIFDPKVLTLAIGAYPNGVGMAKWLENSPTFSASRFRTPLKIELAQDLYTSAIGHWDLFMRLRREQLPVEMTLLPNANKGSHPLQNPGMRFQSEQGAVDWFRFWLQGYEDPDPDKKTQYARWHELRKQRDIARILPRPPRLFWSATPRAAERVVH